MVLTVNCFWAHDTGVTVDCYPDTSRFSTVQALVDRHVQVQHKLLVGQSPPGTAQAAIEQTRHGAAEIVVKQISTGQQRLMQNRYFQEHYKLLLNGHVHGQHRIL